MLKRKSVPGTLTSLIITAGAIMSVGLAGKLLASLVALTTYEARIVGGHMSEEAGRFAVLSSVRAARDQATSLSATATRTFALDARIDMRPELRLQSAAEALMLNPTDTQLWTTYARALVSAGFELKHVLVAIELSRLSGRREQMAMLDRAILTLAIWEKAPSRFRIAALRELHDVRWFLQEPQRDAIARTIAARPDDMRQDVEAQVSRAMAN